MGASGLARVRVAENLVEISWEERETLLERLHDVGGSEAIIERFWAVGASWPVVLNDEQRSWLRGALERWGAAFYTRGLHVCSSRSSTLIRARCSERSNVAAGLLGEQPESSVRQKNSGTRDDVWQLTSSAMNDA
jgi:hypothetical protein